MRLHITPKEHWCRIPSDARDRDASLTVSQHGGQNHLQFTHFDHFTLQILQWFDIACALRGPQMHLRAHLRWRKRKCCEKRTLPAGCAGVAGRIRFAS